MENIKVVTEVLDGLMPYALPAEGKRKCKIFADGKEIFPGSLTVEHDTWALKVGIRPEGWQGFLFRENGGGGSFTIPWACGPKGEILVGMVQENRPNMGGPVWCIMGGFVDLGENHDQSQKREAAEEGGLDTGGAKKLPGVGIVSNRLFWVADVKGGEGGRVFEKEYLLNQLEPVEGEEDVWKPKEGIIKYKKKESVIHFFPVAKAITITGDAFMLSGISQLLVKLGKV